MSSAPDGRRRGGLCVMTGMAGKRRPWELVRARCLQSESGAGRTWRMRQEGECAVESDIPNEQGSFGHHQQLRPSSVLSDFEAQQQQQTPTAAEAGLPQTSTHVKGPRGTCQAPRVRRRGSRTRWRNMAEDGLAIEHSAAPPWLSTSALFYQRNARKMIESRLHASG